MSEMGKAEPLSAGHHAACRERPRLIGALIHLGCPHHDPKSMSTVQLAERLFHIDLGSLWNEHTLYFKLESALIASMELWKS